MVTNLNLSLQIAALFLLPVGQTEASNLRDPTLPPPEKGVAITGAAASTLGIESGAVFIVVRNGVPRLMIDGLLYAQGEKIGQLLIERITETEIWLREGGVLRKVTPFSGVQRRTVPPLALIPDCVPGFPSKTSLAAPCANVQP